MITTIEDWLQKKMKNDPNWSWLQNYPDADISDIAWVMAGNFDDDLIEDHLNDLLTDICTELPRS